MPTTTTTTPPTGGVTTTNHPPPIVTKTDVAHALDTFDRFIGAGTLKGILQHYRTLCALLHIRAQPLPGFLPRLRAHLTTWRAQAVWKKLEGRATGKCYGRGRICAGTRVLVIGAGPCGLRTAIEAQMLGAKVVVLEKRDRMSRNNVLHLWPFVIDDLRSLGAKKFFGKFCAGSIDHISIRQLQCILLKVALLLGVELHTEVSFESLVEPSAEDKRGWRAEVKPSDHPVSQYEFDVIIGADGKRNTLHGFRRKEFRGKLAIAITANFLNRRTEAEARVEEISGVAFIFNQKFFKDLNAETRIDLENIVYYKDDTHYFVMTAKKASLIEKGVIRQDLPDTARLLSHDNVDRTQLMNYAREAAEFSTGNQMMDLEFAVNHYGQPDVAMFDFTSMYAAENASRVIERHGYKLMCILVGDSLLEPFWPTGSGCARGFLSAMDAAWAIRAWGSGGSAHPLDVLAERESIYRLLGQTTPENLHRDAKSYTVDPATRYPNLNRNLLIGHQVGGLYDTDRKVVESVGEEMVEKGVKRRKVDEEVLLTWIKDQLNDYNVNVSDLSASFRDGKALCAILHHYRPDLLDFSALPDDDDVLCNEIAFEILQKEIGITTVTTGEDMASLSCPQSLFVSYLSQVYDVFRREIPHIKHRVTITTNPAKSPTRPILTGLGKSGTHKTQSNKSGIVAKIKSDLTEAGTYKKSETSTSIKTECNNSKELFYNYIENSETTATKVFDVVHDGKGGFQKQIKSCVSTAKSTHSKRGENSNTENVSSVSKLPDLNLQSAETIAVKQLQNIILLEEDLPNVQITNAEELNVSLAIIEELPKSERILTVNNCSNVKQCTTGKIIKEEMMKETFSIATQKSSPRKVFSKLDVIENTPPDPDFKKNLIYGQPDVTIKSHTQVARSLKSTTYVTMWNLADYLLVMPRTIVSVLRNHASKNSSNLISKSSNNHQKSKSSSDQKTSVCSNPKNGVYNNTKNSVNSNLKNSVKSTPKNSVSSNPRNSVYSNLKINTDSNDKNSRIGNPNNSGDKNLRNCYRNLQNSFDINPKSSGDSNQKNATDSNHKNSSNFSNTSNSSCNPTINIYTNPNINRNYHDYSNDKNPILKPSLGDYNYPKSSYYPKTTNKNYNYPNLKSSLANYDSSSIDSYTKTSTLNYPKTSTLNNPKTSTLNNIKTRLLNNFKTSTLNYLKTSNNNRDYNGCSWPSTRNYTSKASQANYDVPRIVSNTKTINLNNLNASNNSYNRPTGNYLLSANYDRQIDSNHTKTSTLNTSYNNRDNHDYCPSGKRHALADYDSACHVATHRQISFGSLFTRASATLNSSSGVFSLNPHARQRQRQRRRRCKRNMNPADQATITARTSHWISHSDFECPMSVVGLENYYTSVEQLDNCTDITNMTSVTAKHPTVRHSRQQQRNEGIRVEAQTNSVTFNSDGTNTVLLCSGGKENRCPYQCDEDEDEAERDVVPSTPPTDHSCENLVAQLYRRLKEGGDVMLTSPVMTPRVRHVASNPFSAITEHDEAETPEAKSTEPAFTYRNFTAKTSAPTVSNVTAVAALVAANAANTATPSGGGRPHQRHVRHVVPLGGGTGHVNKAAPSSVGTTGAAAAVAAATTGDHPRRSRKRKTQVAGAAIGLTVERQQRLEEISANRTDRQSRRKQQRRMQTEQFLKSMQMLQANGKPDHSEPFEDYSIFLYRQTAPDFGDRVKDLERKFTYIPPDNTGLPPPSIAAAQQQRGERDEDFAARIKDMEDKWLLEETTRVVKKPKDLLRAIGKIETSDWNIREIERKIRENKSKGGGRESRDREKVPKWSREQFLARQDKMEKKHLDRQDSTNGKYSEIDKNIKLLDQRLKEGNSRDLNQHKIASITEKLKPKETKISEIVTLQKSNSKAAVVLPAHGASEFCHFCTKRVYLMEKLSAENKCFHRNCFRCEYCHTLLRLGAYTFDRDGKYGNKFFCTQHYGFTGQLPVLPSRRTAKPLIAEPVVGISTDDIISTPDKKLLGRVTGLDLLDRVQTPERIANVFTGNASSDHEESLSIMDEDEWTDRNFGASTAEIGSSDDDDSYSESESEEEFEEALEEPATKEGTMRIIARYSRSRYSRKRDSNSEEYSSSDQSSYCENTSGDEESDTATEGEEEIRARELRKQEVRVEPPIVTDTGTDTEIASDDTAYSKSAEAPNSATEISTDSEFAQDEPTPTREIPAIVFNDAFVTKTRGSSNIPSNITRVQVKSTELRKHTVAPAKSQFTPLVSTTQTPARRPLNLPLLKTEGYALNRTQSTSGIAAMKSLELKKKYLLGEQNAAGAQVNAIQKSGSASTLDSKFKSFHSNITDCQKLLQKQTTVIPDGENEKVAVTKPEVEEKVPQVVVEFQNELEGRPRSPVHETSIIVPEIDWSRQNKKKEEPKYSDSISSESEEDSENLVVEKPLQIEPLDSLNYIPVIKKVTTIPIVEAPPLSSLNDQPKSISSEKKGLNKPKTLPGISSEMILAHQELPLKPLKALQQESVVLAANKRNSSGRSTPTTCNNDSYVTGFLTETELSDWARDGTVSDDFDYEYDFNRTSKLQQGKQLPKNNTDKEPCVKLSQITREFDQSLHICGKTEQNSLNEPIVECVNNILNPQLENIEFMDTGSESSSDEVVVRNNGYVQFQNEDFVEDSLSPIINNKLVDTRNPCIKATAEDFDEASTPTKNTGFCVMIGREESNFGSRVVDLKPIDLAKLKLKQNVCENEMDSLQVFDTENTTEENTCSDSTVKNVEVVNNNAVLDKKRLEDKLAQVKQDMKQMQQKKLLEQEIAKKKEEVKQQEIVAKKKEEAKLQEIAAKKKPTTPEIIIGHSDEIASFEQHCQRLQNTVEFNNARDSLDMKKVRKNSIKTVTPKPDLIREENGVSLSDLNDIITPKVVDLSAAPPKIYEKAVIAKERDVNQRLIHEMIFDKYNSKSLERKKRNRSSSGVSPNNTVAKAASPYELCKSATTDLAKKNVAIVTPDVILTSTVQNPLQKSQTMAEIRHGNYTAQDNKENYNKERTSSNFINEERKESNYSGFITPNKIPSNTKSPNSYEGAKTFGNNYSIYQSKPAMIDTPRAPPRSAQKHYETGEKIRQDARAKAKLLTDADLGLSPEDKLARLRLRAYKNIETTTHNPTIEYRTPTSTTTNPEYRHSAIYMNDTLNKRKNKSFRRSKSGEDNKITQSNSSLLWSTAKSVTELAKGDVKVKPTFKSDSNLLETNEGATGSGNGRKKCKDRERRKSITKFISDLFVGIKRDGNSNLSAARGFLSKISPRSKERSKVKETTLRKSQSDINNVMYYARDSSPPPPVPPLPDNYTANKLEDSSDAELDCRVSIDGNISLDNLDQSSGFLHDEASLGSLSTRRNSRGHKNTAKQAQVKRHRTAQEIQRKLEECEVRIRELELHGVAVEKLLCGDETTTSSASSGGVSSSQRAEQATVLRSEPDLLREWFDVMRDLTELRRYERKLVTRAEELQLEDRHARLQNTLRDQIGNREAETSGNGDSAGTILEEMMEIVAKRDSIIASLEEEKKRYSDEDKEFEQQMLSKGLQIVPQQNRKSLEN